MITFKFSALIFSALFFSVASLSYATHAENTSVDTEALAANDHWLTLLRYEVSDKNGRTQSLVQNQEQFFLSAQGEHDPHAELIASIEALDRLYIQQPDTTNNANASADNDFICRFPARALWLAQQLNKPISFTSCSALSEWLNALNPEQATLIFAADYMNSPSSMFGHTLLRIDTPEQNEETRLLAYAINYAAETRETNGLFFAVKGLTGQYPGAFSVMPYYEKVKEYNDMEDRDLWEYQLSFSPEELNRMLLHLWELKGIKFPYYYFSSNCSYQLLGLFEIARPGLKLRKNFPVYAIPTDTLKRVLEEKNILRKMVYRPSSGTMLNHEITKSEKIVNDAAYQRVNNHALPEHLTPAQQAKALETAYDYAYYRFLSGRGERTQNMKTLRSLLVERSKVDAPDQRSNPTQPRVDPSQGHATKRLAMGAGFDGENGYTSIGIRPAYHDLLDPLAGYRKGAHIDFLNAELALVDNEGLKVDHFILLGINSLAPRNTFLKPISWRVAMGYKQIALNKAGVSYFEGGSGVNYALSDRTMCFGLIESDIQAGTDLKEGWRIGMGPKVGCLISGSYTQWQIEAGSRYRDDQSAWESQLKAGMQWSLNKTNAIRLEATAEQQDSINRVSGGIRWMHYF